MNHYYIYCLHNENLPEYYVGHTKNWRNRWDKHKQDSKISSCKVYKYINNNGGIDNFKMEILYECYCLEIEARQYEKYYKNLLGATLNTQEPCRSLQDSKINYRSTEHGKKTEKESKQKYRQSEHGKKTEKESKQKYLKKQFHCICGKILSFNHRGDHWKSQKHINFIRENIGY
jgi:hypothetical protein